MTSVLIILLFTFWQLVTGFGLLTLFNIRLKPAFFLALSIIMGVAVFSIVPFILQLFYIPVTAANVFIALAITSVLLNLRLRKGMEQFRQMVRTSSFRIKLYETPFLAVITFIIFVSAWRCYYFPPTPSDAVSGAEVVAEYTVREHSMINSAFQVARNGNSLKPPFLTCLQVIYKFAGFPFGQVWLINIFVCFTIILYHLLSTTLHRLLAGLLSILFLAIPEVYAYTFMILYDYSNAVFYFLTFYFLIAWFTNGQRNYLAFAGLLMGIATYIRPETPVLVALTVPAIVWHIKTKAGFGKMIADSLVFVLPSVILYLLSIVLYIKLYIPQDYSVIEQINPHWANLAALFRHFLKTNSTIIFSETGINHYSYYIFIFLGCLLLELIIKRRIGRTARNYLYAVLIVYLAYPTLSHLLPGLTIDYSVKRAYFKLFPVMLLYMANNSLLIGLSEHINRWENRTTLPTGSTFI